MHTRKIIWVCTFLMIMGVAHSYPVSHKVNQSSAPVAKTLSLLDLGSGFENRLRPNSNQVTFNLSKNAAKPGLDVFVSAGKEDFPGIHIKPPAASWNLSPFGHIEAKVVNTSKKPLTVALRIDNAGDWKDSPSNTESLQIEPGESNTITAIFGYSYGHKKGFQLNSSAVVNVLLFAVKVEGQQSFRVESVIAAGAAGEKPPIPPDEFRLAPASGAMFGPGAPLDLATQVTANNVQPLLVDAAKQPILRLEYPPSKVTQSALLKLPFGCWDLRAFSQVQVAIKNMGSSPVTPKVKLYSSGGTSDWIASPSPLAPRQSVVIPISFKGSSPAGVGIAGTGSAITSDSISGLEIQLDGPDLDRVIYVESVQGRASLPNPLPDWVGQRPPVTGDWVQTLDEEFNGSTLDTSIWSVYGENYYDKVSHWSKDEVLVGGGVVRLRYEKKSGFQNDDPKRVRTDYAAGYLQTFDKWAQRYGYFEARMKLPKAPGLWPAFWMMPDRGRTSNPDTRYTTETDGMEFDIMEHLTRWGQYRYNISMHYDGYGVTHKSVGSDKIYIEPDKDGFITCGLLWTPASAIFYCNGLEVLRWENARVASVPCSFLFTLPSGGWDNSPLEDSRIPDDFVIDYVRVWQRKDLASPADGRKPPLPGAKGQ